MIHMKYNGNMGRVFESNFKNGNVTESYLNKMAVYLYLNWKFVIVFELKSRKAMYLNWKFVIVFELKSGKANHGLDRTWLLSGPQTVL